MLSAQQVAEINCHAIRKAGISLQMRYPLTHLFLQMPLNKANCGILAVLAQLKDVPADYLPIYFRYSFIIFFCETYKEYQVRVIHYYTNLILKVILQTNITVLNLE